MGTKPGQTSGRAGFRAGLVKARPSFLKPEPGPKPEILHIFKPEPGPKSSPKPESPARMLFFSTRTCKPGPKPESPARNTGKVKPEPGPNYLSGCKTKPEPGPNVKPGPARPGFFGPGSGRVVGPGCPYPGLPTESSTSFTTKWLKL